MKRLKPLPTSCASQCRRSPTLIPAGARWPASNCSHRCERRNAGRRPTGQVSVLPPDKSVDALSSTGQIDPRADVSLRISPSHPHRVAGFIWERCHERIQNGVNVRLLGFSRERTPDIRGEPSAARRAASVAVKLELSIKVHPRSCATWAETTFNGARESDADWTRYGCHNVADHLPRLTCDTSGLRVDLRRGLHNCRGLSSRRGGFFRFRLSKCAGDSQGNGQGEGGKLELHRNILSQICDRCVTAWLRVG
jgi:hypothetical protein